MGTFDEDAVRLKLDGEEIPIVEDYSVHAGVLEVPAQFQITLGHGGLFRHLIAKYGPCTPFTLFIRDHQVQVGETDGGSLAGATATIMQIAGRDSLARLVDTELLDERTFAQKSFADLVKIALEAVGLGDRPLVFDNSANRKAITGREALQLEKKTIAVLTEIGKLGDGLGVEVAETIKGEAGHTYWDVLQPQFRRAGLFLFSTHDGGFVLGRPNGAQQPTTRILRRRGNDNNQVSVLGRPDWHHSVVRRYSEAIVIGRAGGGKHGRSEVLGRYIDEEMVAILNRNPADRADGGKRRKPKVIRDSHVSTPDQANALARRVIAESRRSAWHLSYTVAGHSAPAIGGGRAVWQPDTVVEVIDDELGIEGPMYVESVAFSRRPETTTVLNLMRLEDLVYAEDVPQKLRHKRGVVPPKDPPQPFVIPWTTDPDIAERIKILVASQRLSDQGDPFAVLAPIDKPLIDNPEARRVLIPK